MRVIMPDNGAPTGAAFLRDVPGEVGNSAGSRCDRRRPDGCPHTACPHARPPGMGCRPPRDRRARGRGGDGTGSGPRRRGAGLAGVRAGVRAPPGRPRRGGGRAVHGRRPRPGPSRPQRRGALRRDGAARRHRVERAQPRHVGHLPDAGAGVRGTAARRGGGSPAVRVPPPVERRLPVVTRIEPHEPDRAGPPAPVRRRVPGADGAARFGGRDHDRPRRRARAPRRARDVGRGGRRARAPGIRDRSRRRRDGDGARSRLARAGVAGGGGGDRRRARALVAVSPRRGDTGAPAGGLARGGAPGARPPGARGPLRARRGPGGTGTIVVGPRHPAGAPRRLGHRGDGGADECPREQPAGGVVVGGAPAATPLQPADRAERRAEPLRDRLSGVDPVVAGRPVSRRAPGVGRASLLGAATAPLAMAAAVGVLLAEGRH